MAGALGILTALFDLLLLPFRGLPPAWGVGFLSLLAAALVLWIYGKVSDQRAIRRIKKRVQGHFLGIYLFRDDPAQVLRSLARVFAGSFRYVGYSLVPLAVVIVPLLLACVQMELRYGRRPLLPGERVIVSAAVSGRRAPVLRASPGLAVETPAVRIGGGEFAWRVRAVAAGDGAVELEAGGATVGMDVPVGPGARRIYPVRSKGSPLRALLSPGLAPIADGAPVEWIRVRFPSASVRLWRIDLHWSIAFFLLAIVFGLALKPVFGVDF
ncbi:MAG: hypothetical protein PHN82_08265 [bacterium]|nr:hypothetical protein [bacterium]